MTSSEYVKEHKTLKYEDRYYIEVQLRQGTAKREIARNLGFSHTAINNEIKKGLARVVEGSTVVYAYRAKRAQQQHEAAVKMRGAKRQHDAAESAMLALCRLLRNGFSPYAAKVSLQNRNVETPCVATIYRYINNGVLAVGREVLLYPGRKAKTDDPRNVIHHDGGISIELRPSEINARKTFGHWEGDLVCGPKGSGQTLLTLIERKTRFGIIRRLRDKSAAAVEAALATLEGEFGEDMNKVFNTITFDNGLEFADANRIKNSCIGGLRVNAVYYCHPYRSNERGSNENYNGLLRRWIKKGSTIESYSNAYLASVQQFLNEYPRKLLGGASAADVFNAELKQLGIVL